MKIAATFCTYLLLANIASALYAQSVRSLICGQNNITKRHVEFHKKDSMVLFNKGREAEMLGIPSATRLSETGNVQTDLAGVAYHRYQQYYKGIPIENSEYVIQEKEGRVRDLKGALIMEVSATNLLGQSATPAISAKRAYEIARDDAGKSGPTDTAYTKPKLVWYNTGDTLGLKLQLAYGTVISTGAAYWNYYIDAKSGSILAKVDNLAYATEINSYNTVYSGKQSIAVEHDKSLLAPPVNRIMLVDYSRASNGLGVYRSTPISGYSPFTSGFPYQFDIPGDLTGDDRYAYDALYGLEKSYDFFNEKFGRKGPYGDNSGADITIGAGLTTSVGYDIFSKNTRIFMGKAPKINKYQATLDAVGHEWTHSFIWSMLGYSTILGTNFEQKLVSEGLADFFGKSIEFYAKGSSLYTTGTDPKANWMMFADLNNSPIDDSWNWTYSRNIANPSDNYNPGYYKPDLKTTSNDHGASTVISHTLYLISQGGTSKDGIDPNAFIVKPLGLNTTLKIAYNAMFSMTRATSCYDFYLACVNSAKLLYGDFSNEQQQVKIAFYATGIGPDPYTVATFYKDNDFSNPVYSLSPGRYTNALMKSYGFPTGSVSSLKVEDGWEAVIFDNLGGTDFSGNYRKFSSNASKLPGFDNKDQSLFVREVGTVLYKDCGFGNVGAGLRAGRYPKMAALDLFDWKAGIVGNDQLSSLVVFPGYKVTLFQDDDYQKSSLSLTASVNCLKDNSFDEKTSSIIVEKLPRNGDVFQGFSHENYNQVLAFPSDNRIAINLRPGDYTREDLMDEGMNDWSVASFKINPGYMVTFYSGDNLSGSSKTYISNLTSVSKDGALTYPVRSISIRLLQAGAVGTIYDGCDYTPTSTGLKEGLTTNTASVTYNNGAPANRITFPLAAVSSIQLPDGYVAVLSDQGNFISGKTQKVSQSTRCLGSLSPSWDNRAASIWLFKPVAQFYSDDDYRVSNGELGEGSYTLAQLKALGLNLSSLRSSVLEPGYYITFFDGDNFTGTTTVYGNPNINYPQRIWIAASEFWRTTKSIIISRIGGLTDQLLQSGSSLANNTTQLGQGSIKVYPNPASSSLNIDYRSTRAGQSEITITNLQGINMMHLSKMVYAGDNKLNISVGQLPVGVYTLSITTGPERKVSKFDVVR